MKLFDRVVTLKNLESWDGVSVPAGANGAIVEIYEDPVGCTVELDIDELVDCKFDELAKEDA